MTAPTGGTGRGIHAEQVVNEQEARRVVRELVDRLLAGESLNELYRDMDARGVHRHPGLRTVDKAPEGDPRCRGRRKGRQTTDTAVGEVNRSDACGRVTPTLRFFSQARRRWNQMPAGDWPSHRRPYPSTTGSWRCWRSPEQQAGPAVPRPGARKHRS